MTLLGHNELSMTSHIYASLHLKSPAPRLFVFSIEFSDQSHRKYQNPASLTLCEGNPSVTGGFSPTTECGHMMTSSNGNIFRVTGPLCGEYTGHRWIPLTKASDAELWCFLWSTPEQTFEQANETPVIWDAIVLVGVEGGGRVGWVGGWVDYGNMVSCYVESFTGLIQSQSTQHGGCRWPGAYSIPVASFTKEVDPRLAKRPLLTNGRLANRELKLIGS